MRSFGAVAFVVLAFAGCLSVDSPDGALRCSDVPQRACPQGFYCLPSNNTCWRYGHFPDLGVVTPPRLGPEQDLSVPVGDDLSTGLDSGTPDDLLQTD